MGKVFDKINKQNRVDNVNAYAALKNQGIQFIKPDAKQIQEWQHYANKATQHLIDTGYLSGEMYNKVKTLLENYRKQK